MIDPLIFCDAPIHFRPFPRWLPPTPKSPPPEFHLLVDTLINSFRTDL